MWKSEEKRIADLTAQLDSTLPAERDAALIALADFSHRSEVRKLFAARAETDPDPDVRYHARRLHAAVGAVFVSPPAPAVIDYLKTFRQSKRCDEEAFANLMKAEEPATRLQTMLVTAEMPVPGVVDLIVPHLKTEQDPWVLAAGVAAVGILGSAVNLPDITPFLRHESPRVIANAVSAAYSLAPDEAFPLATPLLVHVDNRVQGNVLMILLEKDRERFVGHLRLMASSRREAYRATALNCLKEMEPQVIAELALEMFQSEETSSLVSKEVEYLAENAGDGAVPALVQVAGRRPQRVPQVTLILERMAARLSWEPGVLEKHVARITELAKGPPPAMAVKEKPSLTKKLNLMQGTSPTRLLPALSGEEAPRPPLKGPAWLKPQVAIPAGGAALLALLCVGMLVRSRSHEAKVRELTVRSSLVVDEVKGGGEVSSASQPPTLIHADDKLEPPFSIKQGPQGRTTLRTHWKGKLTILGTANCQIEEIQIAPDKLDVARCRLILQQGTVMVDLKKSQMLVDIALPRGTRVMSSKGLYKVSREDHVATVTVRTGAVKVVGSPTDPKKSVIVHPDQRLVIPANVDWTPPVYDHSPETFWK
jgi:hypothetical protein